MHRVFPSLLLVFVLLLAPACQMNERLSGAAMGAAGGALIGGLATGNAAGVLLGGLAGGVAGYIAGDYIADKRERCGPPACDPCAPPPCDPCPPQQQYCPPQQQYTPPPQPYCPPQPCDPCVFYGPRVGGIMQQVPAQTSAADRWVQQGRQAVTAAEAMAAYREALRLDPNHAEALYRVRLLREAGG